VPMRVRSYNVSYAKTGHNTANRRLKLRAKNSSGPINDFRFCLVPGAAWPEGHGISIDTQMFPVSILFAEDHAVLADGRKGAFPCRRIGCSALCKWAVG
jgi:hypothetical protein